MKAKIQIQFGEILGIKVNEELLKKNPALFDSTKKTMQILCNQIERYFKDHKIKVKTSFYLEENEN